jgi:hypothetical protein
VDTVNCNGLAIPDSIDLGTFIASDVGQERRKRAWNNTFRKRKKKNYIKKNMMPFLSVAAGGITVAHNSTLSSDSKLPAFVPPLPTH